MQHGYGVKGKRVLLVGYFGYGNMGLVIDMKYLERHVFRPMTEDKLDMMAIGVKDSKELRCVEISSMLLKYPQCHAMVLIDEAA